MQVDWLTVTAQLVNFLVLVWLLRRFLYKPIMRAMRNRADRIAEQVRMAEAEREQAQAEANRYQEKQREVDESRVALLEVAKDDADNLRRSLEDDARQEVAAIREEWLKTMAEEQAAFLGEVVEQTAEAFTTFARQALADLADAQLEKQVVERFLAELGTLNESELRELRATAKKGDEPLLIRSAFALPDSERARLRQVLRQTLAIDKDLTFERSKDLVCGIELRIGGRLVRWSLDRLLDDLRSDLMTTIETRIPHTEWRSAG
jgi:F-type H+-transporting ATPase subunit b